MIMKNFKHLILKNYLKLLLYPQKTSVGIKIGKMKIFLLALILICNAAAERAFLQIPLFEEKREVERVIDENGHPEDIFQGNWENFKTTPKPQPPAPKNDSVKLYKHFQSHFYAEISVGHPGQKFKMLIELAMLTSWIPSVLCSPFANPACALKNRYQSSKSTTFKSLKANHTIFTDRGKYFGFLGEEKFIIGKLSVYNQTFLEVEEMPLIETFYAEYDGVLGFGLDKADPQKTESFLRKLFQQHRSIPHVFSLYFNMDETTSKGGTLFIGGSEKKHYNGTFTYLPIKEPYYWSFKMDKVSIDYILPYRNTTAEVCSGGCEAFPITGNVLIQGPKQDIKTINRLISANYVPFLDRYEVSCNKINILPKITFYLGGKPFPLHGRHYIQRLSYGPSTLCLSSFTELKNLNGLWGLGVSFLNQYYTEYDLSKKRIGFVKAVGS